jgi:hypothetical protein
MRKVVCAVLLSGIGILGLAPVASASSPWTPVSDPLGAGSPNGSLTLSSNCSFTLFISVVANNERQRQIPVGSPAPAGTTETDPRGTLVLSLASPTATPAPPWCATSADQTTQSLTPTERA